MCTRYSSGLNTMDAPPAKFRLTGGNISLTLKKGMEGQNSKLS